MPEADLRAGAWVEVRSREEILATLDEQGRLENLPFMPEMLQYCGQKLRVSKRADKTCDNIVGWSIRRLKDTVHLENARCNGEEHGGCQAGCLIFWKEAWIKRADSHPSPLTILRPRAVTAPEIKQACTMDKLIAASRVTSKNGERVYSCQATDVRKFSSHMRSLDFRQYVRDLRSGNLMTGLAGDSRAERMLETALGITQILRAVIISLFNRVRANHHETPYPFIAGTLGQTPVEKLDLKPGELVRVRSKEEIFATLDRQNRNRGLLFDSEMLTYCGGIYRVLRRVHRIIDEKTGKMLNMKYPCIVLEGVACRSDYHRLCPRAIYHYWRESWLKRVAAYPEISLTEQIQEECEKC